MDIIIRVGGEGGEGVISVGELLTKACARAGFEIYTYKSYPAEIKGGHAMYHVRAADKLLLSQGDKVDVLVTFNQEAYDKQIKTLKKGGSLVYDTDSFTPPENASKEYILYGFPYTSLARESGGNISKNMVILGSLSGLYNIPADILEEMLTVKFKKKGDPVVEKNLKAFRSGKEYALKNIKKQDQFSVGKLERNNKGYVFSGNQALALGAITAGCRFYAGYPITPATEIMEFLAREFPRLGGVVIQTEDEIAAIGAVLGASYAGKKAMTATSGPGFSLMVEMLGLASMTELPSVVVDVQRGGPSTGLPTKTEQSDLEIAVYGAHGDAPRVVLALSSVEDCYYGMIRAFNIAERLQIPVIVLSDQYLAQRQASIKRPDSKLVTIEERLKPTAEQLQNYKRFQLTANGISPLSAPGMAGGNFVATGLEHDEFGKPSSDPNNHFRMSAKRWSKLAQVSSDTVFANRYGAPDAEIGIISWGSTEGVIREAIILAEAKGIKVAALHTKILRPMPDKAIRDFLRTVTRVIVPELNYTGQFARRLRERFIIDTIRLNKCTGLPFSPEEILMKIEEVAHEQHVYITA